MLRRIDNFLEAFYPHESLFDIACGNESGIFILSHTRFVRYELELDERQLHLNN